MLLPPLQVRLLGEFAVAVHGEPLPRLRSRKSALLLASLALHPRHLEERAVLAERFWPAAPDEMTALGNLKKTVTDIRQVLGPEAGRLHVPRRHALALNLAGCEVDVLAFDTAARGNTTAALQRAMEVYAGPLLEGWGEREGEGWIRSARETRRAALHQVVSTLLEHALEARDAGQARYWLERYARVHRPEEKLWRVLLSWLLEQREYDAARHVYEELQALTRHYASVPGPETTNLFHSIPLAQRFPSRRKKARETFGQERSSLPLTASTFIGREEEKRALAEALQVYPMVTLIGPGGVGKTRLATEVAQKVADRFTRGVAFVDLSGLRDARLFPETLASALRLRPDGVSARDALKTSLTNCSLLLLLDNCEHLLSACQELLPYLLSVSASLRILVTSREPVGLEAEHLLSLPPLSLPPRQAKISAVTLAASEAAQLFCARTQRALPLELIGAEERAGIARLCHALDGLPLAIEIVAASCGGLAPADILLRLQAWLPSLINERARERHRSLEAVLAWSEALLSPEEKTLLYRLSVFSGPMSLAAVEVVCGDEDGLAQEHVPLLLSRLVRRSLVICHPDSASYRLLVTVRAFAAERLPDAERERLRARHAWHYLSTATEPMGDMTGRQTETGIEVAGKTPGEREKADWERDEQDWENYRAALSWFFTFPPHSTACAGGLRLTAALVPLWEACGKWHEAGEWIRPALDKTAEVPSPERAALISRAVLLGKEAAFLRPDECVRLAQESLVFWQQHNHPQEIAQALRALGIALESAGLRLEAQTAYTESLIYWESLGEASEIALTQEHLAYLLSPLGDMARSEALLAEVLMTYRAQDNRRGILRVLWMLANFAHSRDLLAKSASLLEESESLALELGDRFELARCRRLRGILHWRQQEKEQEKACYEQALALYRDMGARLHMLEVQGALAGLHQRQGHLTTARRDFEETLAGQRSIHAWQDVAWTLYSLGDIHCDLEDFSAARSCYEESARLHEQLHYKEAMMMVQITLAELDLRQGRTTMNRVALREAAAYFEQIGKFGEVTRAQRLLVKATQTGEE